MPSFVLRIRSTRSLPSSARRVSSDHLSCGERSAAISAALAVLCWALLFFASVLSGWLNPAVFSSDETATARAIDLKEESSTQLQSVNVEYEANPLSFVTFASAAYSSARREQYDNESYVLLRLRSTDRADFAGSSQHAWPFLLRLCRSNRFLTTWRPTVESTGRELEGLNLRRSAILKPETISLLAAWREANGGVGPPPNTHTTTAMATTTATATAAPTTGLQTTTTGGGLTTTRAPTTTVHPNATATPTAQPTTTTVADQNATVTVPTNGTADAPTPSNNSTITTVSETNTTAVTATTSGGGGALRYFDAMAGDSTNTTNVTSTFTANATTVANATDADANATVTTTPTETTTTATVDNNSSTTGADSSNATVVTTADATTISTADPNATTQDTSTTANATATEGSAANETTTAAHAVVTTTAPPIPPTRPPTPTGEPPAPTPSYDEVYPAGFYGHAVPPLYAEACTIYRTAHDYYGVFKPLFGQTRRGYPSAAPPHEESVTSSTVATFVHSSTAHVTTASGTTAVTSVGPPTTANSSASTTAGAATTTTVTPLPPTGAAPPLFVGGAAGDGAPTTAAPASTSKFAHKYPPLPTAELEALRRSPHVAIRLSTGRQPAIRYQRHSYGVTVFIRGTQEARDQLIANWAGRGPDDALNAFYRDEMGILSAELLTDPQQLWGAIDEPDNWPPTADPSLYGSFPGAVASSAPRQLVEEVFWRRTYTTVTDGQGLSAGWVVIISLGMLLVAGVGVILYHRREGKKSISADALQGFVGGGFGGGNSNKKGAKEAAEAAAARRRRRLLRGGGNGIVKLNVHTIGLDPEEAALFQRGAVGGGPFGEDGSPQWAADESGYDAPLLGLYSPSPSDDDDFSDHDDDEDEDEEDPYAVMAAALQRKNASSAEGGSGPMDFGGPNGNLLLVNPHAGEDAADYDDPFGMGGEGGGDGNGDGAEGSLPHAWRLENLGLSLADSIIRKKNFTRQARAAEQQRLRDEEWKRPFQGAEEPILNHHIHRLKRRKLDEHSALFAAAAGGGGGGALGGSGRATSAEGGSSYGGGGGASQQHAQEEGSMHMHQGDDAEEEEVDEWGGRYVAYTAEDGSTAYYYREGGEGEDSWVGGDGGEEGEEMQSFRQTPPLVAGDASRSYAYDTALSGVEEEEGRRGESAEGASPPRRNHLTFRNGRPVGAPRPRREREITNPNGRHWTIEPLMETLRIDDAFRLPPRRNADGSVALSADTIAGRRWAKGRRGGFGGGGTRHRGGGSDGASRRYQGTNRTGGAASEAWEGGSGGADDLDDDLLLGGGGGHHHTTVASGGGGGASPARNKRYAAIRFEGEEEGEDEEDDSLFMGYELPPEDDDDDALFDDGDDTDGYPHNTSGGEGGGLRRKKKKGANNGGGAGGKSAVSAAAQVSDTARRTMADEISKELNSTRYGLAARRRLNAMRDVQGQVIDTLVLSSKGAAPRREHYTPFDNASAFHRLATSKFAFAATRFPDWSVSAEEKRRMEEAILVSPNSKVGPTGEEFPPLPSSLTATSNGAAGSPAASPTDVLGRTESGQSLSFGRSRGGGGGHGASVSGESSTAARSPTTGRHGGGGAVSPAGGTVGGNSFDDDPLNFTVGGRKPSQSQQQMLAASTRRRQHHQQPPPLSDTVSGGGSGAVSVSNATSSIPSPALQSPALSTLRSPRTAFESGSPALSTSSQQHFPPFSSPLLSQQHSRSTYYPHAHGNGGAAPSISPMSDQSVGMDGSVSPGTAAHGSGGGGAKTRPTSKSFAHVTPPNASFGNRSATGGARPAAMSVFAPSGKAPPPKRPPPIDTSDL